jgi:hypothetical protein
MLPASLCSDTTGLYYCGWFQNNVLLWNYASVQTATAASLALRRNSSIESVAMSAAALTTKRTTDLPFAVRAIRVPTSIALWKLRWKRHQGHLDIVGSPHPSYCDRVANVEKANRRSDHASDRGKMNNSKISMKSLSSEVVIDAWDCVIRRT